MDTFVGFVNRPYNLQVLFFDDVQYNAPQLLDHENRFVVLSGPVALKLKLGSE